MPHQLAVVRAGVAFAEGAVVAMLQMGAEVVDWGSHWHNLRILAAQDLAHKGHLPLMCSNSCLQKQASISNPQMPNSSNGQE